MRTWTVIVGVLAVVVLSGCQNCNLIIDENQSLHAENTELLRRVEVLSGENDGLREQVATIEGLDAQVRLENLITVMDVELARRSGLYDKDRDGISDKLIVYLKTIDEFGDPVKGVGSLEVELWDLNRASENSLLASWAMDPGELKQSWSAALMTNYHRLVYDISSIDFGSNPSLTVKVKFVDYLTGKTFVKQRVISYN